MGIVGVFSAKLSESMDVAPSYVFNRLIKSCFSKNIRGFSLFPKFCLNPLIILCGRSHVDFSFNLSLDRLPQALSGILSLTNMSFMDSVIFCISG